MHQWWLLLKKWESRGCHMLYILHHYGLLIESLWWARYWCMRRLPVFIPAQVSRLNDTWISDSSFVPKATHQDCWKIAITFQRHWSNHRYCGWCSQNSGSTNPGSVLLLEGVWNKCIKNIWRCFLLYLWAIVGWLWIVLSLPCMAVFDWSSIIIWRAGTIVI